MFLPVIKSEALFEEANTLLYPSYYQRKNREYQIIVHSTWKVLHLGFSATQQTRTDMFPSNSIWLFPENSSGPDALTSSAT